MATDGSDQAETLASSPGSSPRRFGRYEIVGELGRGGMGVVFRAFDTRIHREVALKVLHLPPGIDSETAEALTARFLNEARAAGRLGHPNVVGVYDADVDPVTHEPFLAMELVEGTDLKSLMKQGLEPKRLLALLSQVAAALDHAHERGVVHRDVKPANVLVAAGDVAKLSDFGIARLGAQALTQDGQFLGSPSYMSPEQVLSRPVTGATDIYSLAIVAYEGLTGQRPFDGDSLMATTHAITHDEARPASSVAGQLPAGVDSALARGLAKAPEARPGRASDLVRDLESTLDGAPLPPGGSGTPIGLPEEAAPRGSRRKLLVAASAAGLLLIAVVVALVVTQRSRGGPDGTPDSASRSDDAWTWADDAQPAATPATQPAAEPPPERVLTAQPAAPVAAAVPAARGMLRVDLFTFHDGTLVVLDGDVEIGRARTERLKQKSRRLKNPKERYRLTFDVPAGRRTLTFRFTPDGRSSLTQRAVHDVAAGGTLEAVVDVGTLGRDLDLRFP